MSRWLLAGASGYLGSALRERLARNGADVLRLVRREPISEQEVRWDPSSGRVDPDALDGVDVVVCLSGVGVFTGPWTAGRRKAILRSRLDTTGTIARAVAARPDPPALIQASGIALYGTQRRSAPATEDTPGANDFLADVVRQWESATAPAREAGARVVLLRTSPVLGPGGGAFAPMRLAWSLGGGARLGDGRQRMPMIVLEDYLGVVEWAAGSTADGPYNLTIPEPTTNGEYTDALARALHRPRFLAVPAGVLRRVLGELAEQLVGDMFATPQRLTEAGYRFAAPNVDAVIRRALGAD